MRLFYTLLNGLEIVLAIVLLALGLLSLSSSSQWIRTQGVVVKVNSPNEVTVRFQTLYHDDAEVTVSNGFALYDVGDRVSVKYPRNDTRRANLATFGADMLVPLLLFWSALFLLIFACGSLLFRFYYQRKLR